MSCVDLTKCCCVLSQANRWRKRSLSLVPIAFRIRLVLKYPALVSIYDKDGTVAVSHGGVEMGQGINTKVRGAHSPVHPRFAYAREVVSRVASLHIISCHVFRKTSMKKLLIRRVLHFDCKSMFKFCTCSHRKCYVFPCHVTEGIISRLISD